MKAETGPHYPWFINGRQSDLISADDRAVQFGDGLFETMRVSHGVIPLLDRHLRRLALGCQRLGIALNTQQLSRSLHDYLGCLPSTADLAIKLIVSRGVAARGYKPPTNPQPTVAIRGYAYSAPSDEAVKNGVQARLCTTKLGCNPTLAGIKHLNRLEQVLGRAEWDDSSVFEGLMLDVNAYLVEGTMSNLFFVRDATLYTPDLSTSGVAGVMREELIDFFSREKATGPQQGRFNFEHLADASEVFISNSLIGVLSLTRCEHYRWQAGVFAQRARAHISRLYGEVADDQANEVFDA